MHVFFSDKGHHNVWMLCVPAGIAWVSIPRRNNPPSDSPADDSRFRRQTSHPPWMVPGFLFPVFRKAIDPRRNIRRGGTFEGVARKLYIDGTEYFPPLGGWYSRTVTPRSGAENLGPRLLKLFLCQTSLPPPSPPRAEMKYPFRVRIKKLYPKEEKKVIEKKPDLYNNIRGERESANSKGNYLITTENPFFEFPGQKN